MEYHCRKIFRVPFCIFQPFSYRDFCRIFGLSFPSPAAFESKEELKIKTTFRSCPYAKKGNIAGIAAFSPENISATGRLHYS